MASKSPLEINFLSPSIFPVGQGGGGDEAKNFSYASSSKEKKKERERKEERMRARGASVVVRRDVFSKGGRKGEDRMHSRPETSRRRSLGCLRGCRSISFGASRFCSVERAVVGRGGPSGR